MAGRIADAEAVVAEWADVADLDATRTLYSELLDFAQGRIAEVSTPAELGAALRRLLVKVEMRVTPDGLLHETSGLRLSELSELRTERRQTFVERPLQD